MRCSSAGALVRPLVGARGGCKSQSRAKCGCDGIADFAVSEAAAREGVGVQVSPSAPCTGRPVGEPPDLGSGACGFESHPVYDNPSGLWSARTTPSLEVPGRPSTDGHDRVRPRPRSLTRRKTSELGCSWEHARVVQQQRHRVQTPVSAGASPASCTMRSRPPGGVGDFTCRLWRVRSPRFVPSVDLAAGRASSSSHTSTVDSVLDRRVILVRIQVGGLQPDLTRST